MGTQPEVELREGMDEPQMERAPIDNGYYLGLRMALTGFTQLLDMRNTVHAYYS